MVGIKQIVAVEVIVDAEGIVVEEYKTAKASDDTHCFGGRSWWNSVP